jgi:hypothetical protein
MSSAPEATRDVMQVCRNGHVITDLLRSQPDTGLSHCHRCGATTIDRCPTCGSELAGAPTVPPWPVGSRRPPSYCSNCGAAFSWAVRPDRPPAPESLARLEALLRRLPEVIRQLRVRHSDRPPFRVTEERDLEDLVRALLPIQFAEVRPVNRTPLYATVTRTDFLLAPEQIALTVKCAGPAKGGAELARQFAEDAAYHGSQGTCRTLVCFVYDPERLLDHFTAPAIAGADFVPSFDVRWLVAAP